MSTKMPFLINAIDRINPDKDKRWIPDGENMWFLPCVLDLKNNTYSGWWYGSKLFHEDEHYHVGASEGHVLRGKMTMRCKGKKYLIKEKEGFLLPPHVPHSGDLIPGKNGFLFFATVVGKVHYKDSSEDTDVKTYYNAMRKYYLKYKIDSSHIAINKKNKKAGKK